MVLRSVRALGAALAMACALAGSAAAEPMGGERGRVTNLPLPRFVSLRAETANARRGPGLSHRVDWTFVRRGWPLEVTAEYGQWRRVRDVAGAEGWVHHSLLSGTRTAVVVGDSVVRVHSNPSEASAVIALVEPGVVARFEGCEAKWCQVEAGETGGWVPKDVLWGVR
jgi:SH3-like domain-containing protein